MKLKFELISSNLPDLEQPCDSVMSFFRRQISFWYEEPWWCNAIYLVPGSPQTQKVSLFHRDVNFIHAMVSGWAKFSLKKFWPWKTLFIIDNVDDKAGKVAGPDKEEEKLKKKM